MNSDSPTNGTTNVSPGVAFDPNVPAEQVGVTEQVRVTDQVGVTEQTGAPVQAAAPGPKVATYATSHAAFEESTPNKNVIASYDSLKPDALGGIEILIKLAETGEIDPKNVDIIDVTDKFLRAIAAAPKENLRQSGKILFHASVLLRMKAEALLAAVTADMDPVDDDFLEFDEDGNGLIYDSRKQIVGRQITLQDLERALVRRTNTQRNRQRKVTLQQLIDALREAERIDKERADKKPARARIELEGYHEVNDVDDILDLAHDEDIEKTIERIEQILLDFTTSGELIPLLRLVNLLSGRGDWVDAFLAVLFLSNAGKITLEQKEFYGPLFLLLTAENNQLIPQAS
jgi:segregation and condensation protein A